MLLAGGGLRVALATTHLALAEVPAAITAERIGRRLEALAAGLARDFGIAAPRIAVLALNPHAGEGGRFGSEELTHIAPAVEAARARGLRAEGPLPADSAFHRALRGEYDAVLAMYHDQGLAVLKALAFDTGVNLTLGLPIVRTSPDHGTAYDIAGKGAASPNSMIAALKLAREVADRRARPI
jgi:4-hydroxythreonine-4-phosphate dehydrogenase